MMNNNLQQAAQNAGIYDRQAAQNQQQEGKQPINPDAGAPENAGLSTQQFIQRMAPQPNASSEDRRNGVF